MSLVPKDSWSDFYRLFDQAFPAFQPRHGPDAVSPRVDVIEKETAYEVIADLPGVKKEDISVTYQDGVLTISATTSRDEQITDQDKVVHKERYHGKLVRSFSLGGHLLWQDIYAEFEDGVLVVVVPKPDHEVEEPKRIEIS
ncbi:Hsp20/alpha crystallin family protein [Vibrio sp.]|uniref:Hsp20/alpha crystallin family protein n=1 Tax=Vibrio sp. TaxID=678 RepID=UPI003D1461A8